MSRRRAWSEAAAAKRDAVEAYSEPEAEDYSDPTCPQCQGLGEWKWSDGLFECPMCGGSGRLE